MTPQAINIWSTIHDKAGWFELDAEPEVIKELIDNGYIVATPLRKLDLYAVKK